MRCEIVRGVAFHPEPRGLCCDPRECWAASQQLPIPYLSIRGADNLASAVTLVSGFFFVFNMHFFAKVAYGVGLSAKSLAHQSEARKMGHFFLSWHERPQQYSGGPFFYKSFFQVQRWASAVSSTTTFCWCFTQDAKQQKMVRPEH